MQINPLAFEQYLIAFYNLENLFDYRNDPYILDEEFVPSSKRKWTKERYETKLSKLARAISKIGQDQIGRPPHILGVAEVENDLVLEDLVNRPELASIGYKYIHYNSPDERGIDVALLYDPLFFKPSKSEAVTIHLYDEDVRDTTRDILYVNGELAGNELSIYVNHWPSRRKGEAETNQKRVEVAKQLVEHIQQNDPDDLRYNHTEKQELKHFLCIGDFNDDPTDDSVKNHLLPHGFINDFQKLQNNHRGSVKHNKKWYLFDQIIHSASLNNNTAGELYVHSANIFDDIMLRQWKGRYRGYPARTYAGRNYKGGYSDHFPVYMILRRN